MMQTFVPASVAELCDVVRDAAASGASLEVIGAGSRRDFGRPVEATAALSLARFAGVTTYEPEELVLTAGAATPVAEVQALLAAKNQRLAFEPPDLSPLWGWPAGQGTLGGMLAVGLGGSRRVSAGAPRDHFLGFKAVNGFGEVFAAGGRVVKNVTGYDLPKLMAGAFGTLGAMIEVTVKVLPKAEATRTLAILGLDETDGLALLRAALGSSAPVTAAAHLSEAASAALGVPGSATLLRLESVPPTISAAAAELAARTPGSKRLELDEAGSDALWTRIGGGAPLAGGDASVWRLSIPAARAADVGEALRRAGVQRLYYDWGGGAVWLEGLAHDDGGAEAIRQVVRTVAGGGHATLIRGPAELRARVEPFEPLAPALAALTARVKRQFDPAGVFNAGRMYRGV